MRDATHALLVIDVQNDFCPGGALAVPGGDEIVPGINALMAEFAAVILTQDWHPADHLSFASQHPGKAPMEMTEMPYGPQVLWPDHCVQGSEGAAFHPDLDTTRADLIIRKGFRREIDSYSAFFENDQTTPTGLEGYLRSRGITTLTIVGLATDFCVNFSAVDAAAGVPVEVRGDLARAIDLDGSLAAAQDRHDPRRRRPHLILRTAPKASTCRGPTANTCADRPRPVGLRGQEADALHLSRKIRMPKARRGRGLPQGARGRGAPLQNTACSRRSTSASPAIIRA
jgi:nicotinamidase/pyrazinamidase